MRQWQSTSKRMNVDGSSRESILFDFFASRTTEWIESRAIRSLSAVLCNLKTINRVRLHTSTSKMQALANRARELKMKNEWLRPIITIIDNHFARQTPVNQVPNARSRAHINHIASARARVFVFALSFVRFGSVFGFGWCNAINLIFV